MKLSTVLLLVISANFKVFCDEVIWFQMDPTKNLPSNCVVGGLEVSDNYKGPLYIGRKQIENELVIGKVIDAWKSGYFPKDGKEHWSDRYEVLCSSNVNWISKAGDMKNAIAGGKAGNDEPFYVCRANNNGQLTPGKLYKPTGCCYICHYGKEECITDYSVLTNSPSSTSGQSFAYKTTTAIFYS